MNIKLTGVDGNGGQFLFCCNKCGFCLFAIQSKVVLHFPVFNVWITVSCGFQQSVDVFMWTSSASTYKCTNIVHDNAVPLFVTISMTMMMHRC